MLYMVSLLVGQYYQLAKSKLYRPNSICVSLREHQGLPVLTDLSQVHLREQIGPSVLTDIALST